MIMTNIEARVRKVLAESLGVDDDELYRHAMLHNDLGAESIDFLDIVFRLEREFGVKIPRSELFPESIFAGDPEFAREGRITDRGMLELRRCLPYADLSRCEAGRRVSCVGELFTVGLVVNYIGWKLQQPAHSPAISGDFHP
jgi:acyl carrier protein